MTVVETLAEELMKDRHMILLLLLDPVYPVSFRKGRDPGSSLHDS